MDKAALKDSFERILHEADGASLWEKDELPLTEDWELFDDLHFMVEMEQLIESNRLSIATAQHRKAPRRLSLGLRSKRIQKAYR